MPLGANGLRVSARSFAVQITREVPARPAKLLHILASAFTGCWWTPRDPVRRPAQEESAVEDKALVILVFGLHRADLHPALVAHHVCSRIKVNHVGRRFRWRSDARPTGRSTCNADRLSRLSQKSSPYLPQTWAVSNTSSPGMSTISTAIFPLRHLVTLEKDCGLSRLKRPDQLGWEGGDVV